MSLPARPDRPALLTIAHGTRNPAAVEESERLCALLRERLGVPVANSWIEWDLVEPSPVDAAGVLARDGVASLVTLPFLVLGAGHAKTDVPALVDEVHRAHPQLRIHHGRVIGLHDRLFAFARRCVAEGRAAAWGADSPIRDDEALLVTGAGASDPDANGDLAKAARFLAETTGHRWAEIAYSGVTWPRAEVALRRLHAAGARRVVRFSWSLLAGLLERRIDDAAAKVAADTGLDIVDAGRFAPVSEIVDAVADRYREALAGEARMNCDLCQFRLPLPGREKRAGLPSAGGTGERVRDDALAIQRARAASDDYLEWKGG